MFFFSIIFFKALWESPVFVQLNHSRTMSYKWFILWRVSELQFLASFKISSLSFSTSRRRHSTCFHLKCYCSHFFPLSVNVTASGVPGVFCLFPKQISINNAIFVDMYNPIKKKKNYTFDYTFDAKITSHLNTAAQPLWRASRRGADQKRCSWNVSVWFESVHMYKTWHFRQRYHCGAGWKVHGAYS